MNLRAFVLCTFSLLPALAPAEVKTVIIPPEQMERTTGQAQLARPVKFSLNDTTIADAVAAFVKETGVQVQVDPQDQPQAGPVIRYDLKIDAATLDEALDQLGKSVRRGIYRQSDTLFRLSPNSEIGFNERRSMNDPFSEGPRRAEVAQVRVLRIAGSTGGTYYGSDFVVSLRIAAKDVLLNAAPVIKLTEAIDDQGRTLEQPPAQPNNNFVLPSLSRVRSSQGASLTLKRLDPDVTMIKSLKGDIVLSNVKSFSQTTVTELEGKPVEITIAGTKMLVGPLADAGNGLWRLPVKVPLDNPQDQQNMYRRMSFLFHDSAFGIGEKGERLRVNSMGSTSGDGFQEFSLQFYGAPEASSTQPATQPTRARSFKPVSITWSAVHEVETITIPFEAANLPVP